MFSNNKRRFDNQVNAGSMADIAFLLLIFFLVTTTILVDEGILVRLPPWSDDVPDVQIHNRNLLVVKINANDELLIENETASIDQLRGQVKLFVTNPYHSGQLAVSPDKAVVSLQNDRGTSYDFYINVYNELKGAYVDMWEDEAQARFGREYQLLADWQRKRVHQTIPMLVSEAEPTEYGETKAGISD